MAATAAVSRETSERLFGDRLSTVHAYADLLRTAGIERGLIGPREGDRIWDRHVLNSAALALAVPPESTVLDIGSGAGLPGIVLAVARPDVSVGLVEPLQRRCVFLHDVVADLHLDNVEVIRDRAERLHGQRLADVVTARGVAPLERLVGWCLPLVRPGGSLLALKGARAGDELAAVASRLRRRGASEWWVADYAVDDLDPPARVVHIMRSGA